MNLPALPAIASHFHVAVSVTQLMLTSFLIGLAVGQILFGALSDVLGRRRPFVIGLVTYVAASLLCALAPSIGALIAFRVLQGIGAAAAIVTARAIVRDMYVGARAAQYLSRLTLVVGLAPVVAPTVGAQVLRATSWRGIFVVLAAIVALVLVAVPVIVPETLPAERRRPAQGRAMARAFGNLLGQRDFLGFAITLALANATVTMYIAGSPFVLHERYGLSPQGLGIVFGINALALIAGSQANAYLVRRVAVPSVLTGALVTSVAVSYLLLALALNGAGLVPVVACFFVAFGLWGFTASNVIVLAMARHPEEAGSAAALLGLAQWGVGGLAAPLIGLGGAATVVPLAAGMALCSSAALATLLLTAPRGHEELAVQAVPAE
jgi:DHA1 family bicyclomycin/chloramphenicol resistance-like MFS transporter